MSSEDIQRRLRLGPDEAMQLQAYLDAKAEEAAGDPDCTAGAPEECQEHQEIDRIAAIHRALAHPMFYNGDMGADIRWLLAHVAALKHELIGANEMKAKLEQSAAEGWASYRELRASMRRVRERFTNYRRQRPRSFNGEMVDEVALEREDQLMDLFLRDLAKDGE
jgi:hypothetical protein